MAKITNVPQNTIKRKCIIQSHQLSAELLKYSNYLSLYPIQGRICLCSRNQETVVRNKARLFYAYINAIHLLRLSISLPLTRSFVFLHSRYIPEFTHTHQHPRKCRRWRLLIRFSHINLVRIVEVIRLYGRAT
jgi:hypothetical protein